jgi:uncharacterized small protein (DUF1192 family)
MGRLKAQCVSSEALVGELQTKITSLQQKINQLEEERNALETSRSESDGANLVQIRALEAVSI